MPFKRNPELMRINLYALLGFYLFSLFLLAVAWEFKLEAVAMNALDLPYDSEFEIAERWRFVLTSASFAVLSMVAPLFLLKRLIGRLQSSFNDLVVEQAHSDSLARHDPLSGLFNRRVFHEQLATRLEQPSNHTAVFLIDIDNFKIINDTHGHAAGDGAICLVADRLREATAGWEASLARLGGDEFALAVSGDFSRHELQRLAETVLEKIAEPATCLPGVRLSATLGISMSPVDGTAPEALLHCADSAMYRGKKVVALCSFFMKPVLSTSTAYRRVSSRSYDRLSKRTESSLSINRSSVFLSNAWWDSNC